METSGALRPWEGRRPAQGLPLCGQRREEPLQPGLPFARWLGSHYSQHSCRQGPVVDSG